MGIIVFFWGIATTLSIQLDRALSVGEDSLPIGYIYISNRIECYKFIYFSDQQTQYQSIFSEIRNPYMVRDIFGVLLGIIRGFWWEKIMRLL